MSTFPLYNTLSAIEIALSVVALMFLIRAGELKSYWPMLIVSNWQTIPFFTLEWLRAHGREHAITAKMAYIIYFYTFYSCFALQAIFAVLMTYFVLREAMRPLKGLQQLGNIVYWWIFAISSFLALDAAHATSVVGGQVIVGLVTELQRISGTLTVSLVIFVCLAIRPMGLSLKSRVFGVSFGLVITSLVTTIQAPSLFKQRYLYRPYAIVQILVGWIAQLIWIWYFSRPEPKRKFVLLATTSPFHAWNRIAEQFGAEPGFVAIGGVPPDAFAAAEIEIFHRASEKMNTPDTSDEKEKGK
ncbi:hypothetical protein [Terriglobus roseus]|uniref:Uncharacterized protein n=1 Tax=Terriglobus roseus TaxID=392734 RepID=A0A1G7N7E9_9BACT|nr:hypothetical protein [Terriglobus roseus]SDF69279.1 hypothetical protein SAMN05444167_3017 [Terriglobus roseus]